MQHICSGVGACEGSLACSTCHVIVEVRLSFSYLPEVCSTMVADGPLHSIDLHFLVETEIVASAVHQDQDKYDIMPEPDDDENDMLDLAFALTDT